MGLAQDLKLIKVPKNERIFNYGQHNDTMYVVIRGQIGILYPDLTLKEIIDSQNPALLHIRTELMNKKQVSKLDQTNLFLKSRREQEAAE